MVTAAAECQQTGRRHAAISLLNGTVLPAAAAAARYQNGALLRRSKNWKS